MSELLDIYDENLEKVGAAERDEVHRFGYWHRTFHCWFLIEDRNIPYMVMQRRSSSKKIFPNKVSVPAAGHYRAGESIKDGVREIREELGVEIIFDDLTFVGTRINVAKYGELTDREFVDVFFYKYTESLDRLSPSTEEVAQILLVRLQDGVNLFSGIVKSIPVIGIMGFESQDAYHETSEMSVTLEDFIERSTPYNLPVFLQAQRFHAGIGPLSI